MSRKSRIVNTYALVILFLVLFLPHARASAPTALAIRARYIYYQRRTVEANRRPKGRSADINLVAREKKKERKRKRKGEERKRRIPFFLFEEEGPPTYLSTNTRSHLFFAVTPALCHSSLRHLLYTGLYVTFCKTNGLKKKKVNLAVNKQINCQTENRNGRPAYVYVLFENCSVKVTTPVMTWLRLCSLITVAVSSLAFLM